MNNNKVTPITKNAKFKLPYKEDNKQTNKHKILRPNVARPKCHTKEEK